MISNSSAEHIEKDGSVGYNIIEAHDQFPSKWHRIDPLKRLAMRTNQNYAEIYINIWRDIFAGHEPKR